MVKYRHILLVWRHHRNFAAAIEGKTLVPYYIEARDDETLSYSRMTARHIAQCAGLIHLYDHEGALATGYKEPKFSYTEIYPNIVELLTKRKEDQEL